MWLESLASSIVICPKNDQIAVILLYTIPLLGLAAMRHCMGLTTMQLICINREIHDP